MDRRELPDNWDANLPTFAADAKGLASRASSGKVEERRGPGRAVAIGRIGRLSPFNQHAADV